MTDERLRLVAELQNKASAELRRLTKDLDGVKPHSGMIAARKWFDDFQAAGKKAQDMARPLPGMFSAIGVGSVAAGLSLGAMVKQFRDLAAEIPKLKELGRESGMSETEIKRLAYAARLLNADGDKMGASISTWSGKMAEFRRHGGKFYHEMIRGNSDLARKMASEGPAEMLKDTLTWLAKAPEAAKAYARQMGKSMTDADAVQVQKGWAEEIFGGDDILPMVANLQKMQDAMAKASQDVKPITPELIAQADALNQSLTRFDQTWSNFKTEVGPTILNGLSETVDKLDRVFKLVQAHPVESAIAGGGAAALFARNRIMRGSSSFGLRDAATRQMEAAAALKGAAASLAEGRGAGGPRGPGGNEVPSLGSRIAGFAFGLGGIAMNAPSMDASGDGDRQANYNALDSAGNWLTKHLGLDSLRERIFGSGASAGTADGKKDVTDAVKTGTIAAWREISQQQDLGSGTGAGAGDAGRGLANLRYGRGAGGGYRHTLGQKYDLSDGGTGSKAPISGLAFKYKSVGIANRLKQDFPGLGDDDAAAILGNLGHESAGFRAFNEGGGGPGRGWAQWTEAGRKARFFEYAKLHGLDPRSDDANYGFLRWELQHTHKGAIDALKRAKGLREKTRAFEGAFEGAGVKAYGSRDSYADAALSAIQGAKLQRHASGGLISGPGGPQSDSVFARLSNGEFVVNARAAGRNLPLLHAINTGRVGSWMSFFQRSNAQGGMGAPLHVARAAVAMMQGESGRGLNAGTYGWDVNGPSGGTAQWHDVTKGRNAGKVHRLSDLMAFAMSQHADWRDVGIQQAWWKHEALGPLRGAWRAMSTARTAAAALRAGINRFEVPADKVGEFHRRLPNLVRLARQDAGTSAVVAAQRRMEGELHVHVHEGRPARVTARSHGGLKMHIRSNPTMVATSTF